jgi:hypothetical protein
MFGNMRPTMTRSAKWITIAIVLATIVLLPILWYYYPFSFLDSSLVVSERYVAIGGGIEGIEVRRKANLSGPNSAGREWNGSYLTKPKEVKTGYWYGPASPATGWSAIPDVPDIKRRAGDKPRPRGEQPDL